MCGVTSSSPEFGPMVRASRTITQPPFVCHVVETMLVPASYARAVGTLMPKGPKRKYPAWRSSKVPNTLGASKLGTHSHPTPPSGEISAPVWQLDKNA